ncbi:hypothetical protein O0L34_g17049 [Tuta absoluta]|nr:hypothetical protein O0L34_g17049 [Tuta absoluta]
METHTLYNGKPPHYDIALLLVNRPDKKGLPEICDKLKIVSLPKKFLANKFGGRAILVAHEYYYEHFYFTTRLTRTESTTKTSKDDMYYSSEYYSDAEDTCCSTPKSLRLLRRRPVENVIRIENCPRDINGYFFCNHEQNRPVPNEGDIGTGVINRFGRLIGILSFQRFVTYGSNINFYIDVHASVNWIKSTMNLMFEKEKNVTSKAPFTLKIF